MYGVMTQGDRHVEKEERAGKFNKTEEESQCQPGYIDGASC
jgi:hypothetical protein